MLGFDAFQAEMIRHWQFDLPAFQNSFRRQRIRQIVAIALGLFGFALGILTFFPFTMVIFLFALYFLYLVTFGKRRRVKRVKKDSELRRLLIKATTAANGHPFSFLTHRYMPAFVFKESELFPFKPDIYEADELVEVNASGKVTFSHIHAEEKIDAFDRKDADQKTFDGWLFRIFPTREAVPLAEKLPEDYRVKITPDQIWMAVPQKGNLYQRGMLKVEPDLEACYQLYQAIVNAAAMTKV